MTRPIHHVLSVRALTADAFVLRLERHGLAFQSGQHVTLGVHGAGINREYSIYSSPADSDLDILIRIRHGSDSARRLRDSQPGDALDLSGPYGAFEVASPDDAGQRHLFVATGAGIAPFHCFARTWPALDYQLVHGIRTLADAYDRDTYAPGRYVPCVSADPAADAFQGRVIEWLAAHPVAPPTRCYLCGHAQMIANVYDLLRGQGVSSDNLLTEVFFLMRVAISYPPITNARGQVAMVSQNRNVQFFKYPTYLLPVIHGQAATWLQQLGVEVRWDDGNAQRKTYEDWYRGLLAWAPDIVVFESTTPVMKFYWRTINRLKADRPRCIVVMTGYHSMRRPDETLTSSAADVVLLSNHVDFVLRRFVPYVAEHENWRVACDIEGLTIRVDEKLIRSTGTFKRVEDLDASPDVDRDLVRWRDYANENGNFLQTPGTYATSVIRDCTFGQCTFCRYNGPDLTFSVRSVNKSLDEYQRLIEDYGVREIFDDSGVWYRGDLARQFARGVIDRGLHRRGVYFGFNTRFAYLDEETIALLGKANFRFVLVGLEACDEETLDRLHKGYLPHQARQNLEGFTKYGLHPHLTVMVGYYWQTQAMLDLTVRTVREYMFRGLARTLQVTYCTPLDYTPYHLECIEKGVLLTDDYDDFDMSRLIVKTPEPHAAYTHAVRRMYGVAVDPRFLWRQIRFLMSGRKRDWQFLFAYGWRALRRVRNHLYNLTARAD